jgi:hypothetical protein
MKIVPSDGVAKALLLQFDFSGYLREIARRAAKGCTAIATSSTLDTITSPGRRAGADLKNPSETAKGGDTAVNKAVASTARTATSRVGGSSAVQMVKADLVLLVNHARAAPREQACPSITATVAQPIAPLPTIMVKREVFDVFVTSDLHAWGGLWLLVDPFFWVWLLLAGRGICLGWLTDVRLRDTRGSSRLSAICLLPTVLLLLGRIRLSVRHLGGGGRG